MENLGFDINELNGHKVEYENIRFTGTKRTIARLYDNDGMVKSISFVAGEDNNLQAYLSLATKLAKEDKVMDKLAKEIYAMLCKGMTHAMIAKEINRAIPYVSQIVMLYKLKENLRAQKAA